MKDQKQCEEKIGEGRERAMKGMKTNYVDACEKARVKEEEEYCPLFMDGLPSNFAEHKGLAAIASLLQEEEWRGHGHEKQSESFAAEDPRKLDFSITGGGKAKPKNRRHFTKKMSSTNHIPYPTSVVKSSNKLRQKSTLGEAQLFFNMWKI